MTVRFSSGEPPRTESRLSNSAVAATPGSVCSVAEHVVRRARHGHHRHRADGQLRQGRHAGCARGHDLDRLLEALLSAGVAAPAPARPQPSWRERGPAARARPGRGHGDAQPNIRNIYSIGRGGTPFCIPLRARDASARPLRSGTLGVPRRERSRMEILGEPKHQGGGRGRVLLLMLGLVAAAVVVFWVARRPAASPPPRPEAPRARRSPSPRATPSAPLEAHGAGSQPAEALPAAPCAQPAGRLRRAGRDRVPRPQVPRHDTRRDARLRAGHAPPQRLGRRLRDVRGVGRSRGRARTR